MPNGIGNSNEENTPFSTISIKARKGSGMGGVRGCNSRTWEAGRFRVQGQSELYSKNYSIHTGLVGVVVIVNLATVQPKDTEMTEALSVHDKNQEHQDC